MIVVSDTTPIISFLKINRLDILETLFGEVLLPEAVFEELVSNPIFQEEADKVKNCSFLKKVSIANSNTVNMLMRMTGWDLGESEAIIYSDENKITSFQIGDPYPFRQSSSFRRQTVQNQKG